MNTTHHHRKTVLHIEDDPEQRTLLSKMLCKQYKYVGREQAEQAEGLLEDTPIHFIILDLALPLMNGFEFLKKTADILKRKKIPVILTTGVEGRNIQELSREYHCYAFLSKPYNPKSILELLDRYFTAQPPDS